MFPFVSICFLHIYLAIVDFWRTTCAVGISGGSHVFLFARSKHIYNKIKKIIGVNFVFVSNLIGDLWKLSPACILMIIPSRAFLDAVAFPDSSPVSQSVSQYLCSLLAVSISSTWMQFLGAWRWALFQNKLWNRKMRHLHFKYYFNMTYRKDPYQIMNVSLLSKFRPTLD